jgi:hypothetical protein
VILSDASGEVQGTAKTSVTAVHAPMRRRSAPIVQPRPFDASTGGSERQFDNAVRLPERVADSLLPRPAKKPIAQRSAACLFQFSDRSRVIHIGNIEDYSYKR